MPVNASILTVPQKSRLGRWVTDVHGLPAPRVEAATSVQPRSTSNPYHVFDTVARKEAKFVIGGV